VWNLDTTTLQWSRLKVSGTAPPRRLHTATLVPNSEDSDEQSIICFGGEGQDRHVLGGAFILYLCGKSNRWAFRRFSSNRCGHSAVALNASEILIFGGHDGRKFLNDYILVNLSKKDTSDDLMIESGVLGSEWLHNDGTMVFLSEYDIANFEDKAEKNMEADVVEESMDTYGSQVDSGDGEERMETYGISQ